MSLDKVRHEAERWQETAAEDLDAARALLDRYYIPTRYPNGLPDLTPGKCYFQKDADLCIRAARRLLDRVRACMSQEK